MDPRPNFMDREIEQLIQVLHQSEEHYCRLLVIIEQETQAALGSDMHQLMSKSAEKQGLLAQLKRAELERARIVRHIAGALNLPHQEINLTTLAGEVRSPYGLQLRRLNASLVALVDKIRQANADSRLLLQHCLGLVRNALGFFYHWMGPAEVYGASGHMDGHMHGGRLLSGSV